jgi:hypothetical protein
MGGRTEGIQNSDVRQDTSQGITKWAGSESEGDSESRHYIYDFSLCALLHEIQNKSKVVRRVTFSLQH